MLSIFATFLGIDASLILLATVILAAIVTGLSVLIITFMAIAPHYSANWANEFGISDDESRTS